MIIKSKIESQIKEILQEINSNKFKIHEPKKEAARVKKLKAKVKVLNGYKKTILAFGDNLTEDYLKLQKEKCENQIKIAESRQSRSPKAQIKNITNKDEKAAVMEMVNLIKKNELYIKNINYLLSGN